MFSNDIDMTQRAKEKQTAKARRQPTVPVVEPKQERQISAADELHALLLLANEHLQHKRYGEAEASYRALLQADPSYPHALNNLGVLLMETRRLTEAEEVYRESLVYLPQSADTYNNLGNLFRDMNRFTEAEEALVMALNLQPGHIGARTNKGMLHLQTQQFEAAEAEFGKVLELLPHDTDSHTNMANLYRLTKRHDDAKAAVLRAIELGPTRAEPYISLANLLMDTAEFDLAEATYRRALELDPVNVYAHYNLSCLLLDRSYFEQARASFENVLRLRPDWSQAMGHVFYTAAHVCDWAGREARESALAATIADGAKGVSAFTLLLVDSQPRHLQGQFQKRCARLFALGELGDAALAPVPATVAPVTTGRIHIGYLSADFHSHATMHLLRGVLALHDRSRFCVYGYSYGQTRDEVTTDASDSCEVFRDLGMLSDQAAAEQIESDGIALLIDLKGFTQYHRIGITNRRPAPVIISWLGFPGTLGVERLADYIIGDTIVSPAASANDFSETLALMPNCYQPNDDQRPIGRAPTRQEAGLPEQGFVFCSLNRCYKINPKTFDVWCGILKRVPDSVLWLLAGDVKAMENLRCEASMRGVDPTRLIFAYNLPQTEHLGRLQLADLALDTFPVNSHTTASDALWVGVPIVTKTGASFVSRVATSLLVNIGLPELITEDDDAYAKLAIELALDSKRLGLLRRRLAKNRSTHPLFNTVTFTADLERLYEKIWQQHLDGKKEMILLSPKNAPMTSPPQANAPRAAAARPEKGIKNSRKPAAKPAAARLNVGCGRDILPGWVNLDKFALPGVDLVADLDECASNPLALPDDSVEEFLLSHVIEQVKYPLPLMQELWRVAKDGAKMVIKVPHGASDEAWEDPSHVRAYYTNSFGYFSQPYYWRADYGYRGDWRVDKITFLVTRAGNEGLTPQELLHRVNTGRNVVIEMIAELTCMKPRREPLQSLQNAPHLHISLQG